mmetsp:Transcript_11329/g.26020  ORF Transcript_11329/g.26020 Transcript_11329/m.26020 type:complete len:204 (+) Transcript_11329:35-646(+)
MAPGATALAGPSVVGAPGNDGLPPHLRRRSCNPVRIRAAVIDPQNKEMEEGAMPRQRRRAGIARTHARRRRVITIGADAPQTVFARFSGRPETIAPHVFALLAAVSVFLSWPNRKAKATFLVAASFFTALPSNHRSRRPLGFTRPAAGSAWQNNLSKTLTDIVLPSWWPSLESDTTTLNLVGSMPCNLIISVLRNLRPRLVTQ